MHNKLVKNFQSFKTKVPHEIINADNFDHMIARSFKLLMNDWILLLKAGLKQPFKDAANFYVTYNWQIYKQDN